MSFAPIPIPKYKIPKIGRGHIKINKHTLVSFVQTARMIRKFI